LLGLALVLGWWYFSLVLLIIPGLVLFFLLATQWKKPLVLPVLKYWGGVVLTFTVLALPFLLLPHTTGAVVKRTIDTKELLQFPWTMWLANSIKIGQWFVAFVPAPIVFFSLLGLRSDPKKLWRGLAVFTFMPLAIAMVITTSFSARNTVFVVPTLLLLSVRGLLFVPYKKFFIVLSLVMSTVLTSLILFFPLIYYQSLAMIPQAQIDFKQYVMGWSSGYGINEAVGWLTRQAKRERLVVVVRNDSGSPEDAMFTYLEPHHIPVIYPDQIAEVKRFPATFTYYFVSRGSQYGDFKEFLTEMVRFNKPLDKEFVGIYKLR
jgi:hypothetical protein